MLHTLERAVDVYLCSSPGPPLLVCIPNVVFVMQDGLSRMKNIYYFNKKWYVNIPGVEEVVEKRRGADGAIVDVKVSMSKPQWHQMGPMNITRIQACVSLRFVQTGSNTYRYGEGQATDPEVTVTLFAPAGDTSFFLKDLLHDGTEISPSKERKFVRPSELGDVIRADGTIAPG
jgi:hypothetical protein